MAERARRWEQSFRERIGIVALLDHFSGRYGTAVRGGPFLGLEYTSDLIRLADAPVAKLLGSYEEELHEVIALEVRRAPAHFIDIGCAEGYYAVGFATACPSVYVHAFDLARSARASCRALAIHNGVDGRMAIGAQAGPDGLRKLPLNGSLVLSDCEGCELDTFTTDVVRLLETAHVVVELHEDARPGVTETLVKRFDHTHTCALIQARRRNPLCYPLLADFDESECELALAEMRPVPGHCWGVFLPRA